MGVDLTGIGAAADLVSKIVDIFVPPKASAEERLAAEIKIREAVQDYENTVVQAKAAIMTAELAQDDKLTKRARPSIIYGGLLVLMANHVVFPMTAWVLQCLAFRQLPPLPDLSMPTEFWMVWGGVCSIYVLGRSREKAGVGAGGLLGRVMDMIVPEKDAKKSG